MGWIGSEFSNFFIFTFFDFFFPSLHPSLHIIILHPPPHVISLCLPFAPVLKLLRLRLGRFFVFVLLLGFGELFNWEGLLFFIFLFIFTLLGLGQCPGSDFFFCCFFQFSLSKPRRYCIVIGQKPPSRCQQKLFKELL